MGKNFQVLVIDDEEDLRENLKYVLQMKGYDVQLAGDGVQGLKKLESYSPDLIILDMNMPNMGGVEFYERICEGGNPKFPVFILTARANMEQLFKDFKVEGFMAKPFEIEDFTREVGIIVEKRNRVVDVVAQKRTLSVKSVYLAENDPAEGGPIALALLEAGYRVAWAKSGTAALEVISIAPPVLGLVKLGLADISGDVVAQRALHMAKTSGVKFLLYQKNDPRFLRSVRQQIGEKTDVVGLVEYDAPADLVRAVDEAIQKGGVVEHIEEEEI